MFSHSSFRWIRKATVVLFALLVPLVVRAQDPTAPTASEDPEKIDQLWQKASSKYDAQRTTLLQNVDQAAHQGPFRPDWESLKSYEAPEWYRDAKFGIFLHWGRSGLR
jgi:alpha-L-fucosidase